MSIKFRSIEKIVEDLILQTSDYCYEGWTLHAIGTTSDHKYSFLLSNEKGKEMRIEIDQFEED